MADDASGGGGDIRETILAEIAADNAETAAPVEDAPVEEVADVEADATEAEAAGPDDDAPVEDEADESDDDDPDLTSSDPKEQKLLDNVRRAEKRMRALAEKRDAEFHVERQRWQQQVDRVSEVEKLLARAKHDPISLLKAAGVSAEDYELIAQAIYADSPALANDPKQKAAATARLREREKEEKLTAAENRIADLEAKHAAQIEQVKVQAEAAQYIQQLNATAAAKYPLVAHMLKVDVEETNDKLVATYNRLGTKLNRAPKPAEVIAEYDRSERSRLTKLGVDPNTIAKGKPAVAAKPAANSNAPAKADPVKPVASTNSAKKLSPDEERAAILAEIEAGRTAADKSART